ncbi:MAG: urate hydroxylase PuuD [Pseudomonadota bacterium]
MDIQWLDWLTLLLRWLHVITAIAWIGASFYFIWLDLSLQTPSPDRKAAGLGGELYAIHGGGIYQVGKYTSHPTPMPGTLHWFKWEAYSTWLTGTALMIAIYYFKADAYLVGANLWVDQPRIAVLCSVGYLLGGLLIYELLMRYVVHTTRSQAIALIALLTCLSWIAFNTFAPRAAILHVGAVLATMMAANVFLVIIPSQKKFVAAIDAKEPPDLTLQTNAKLRSTHNNYLTLPVLFCMLANHNAFVYSHPQAWLFVIGFSGVAAYARHYFNVKHRGENKPHILAVAAALFVALIVTTQVTRDPVAVDNTAAIDLAQVDVVVATHCANCHAQEPTVPGFVAPPKGMIFATAKQLDAHAEAVRTSLQTNFMPLGNMSGMSAEERTLLLSYLSDR